MPALSARDHLSCRLTHLFRLGALATILVCTLCACGSSGTAAKIAKRAKDLNHASSASCRKVGLMVFVGQQQDVYGCRLTDVPLAYRPIATFDSSTSQRCFVYASGTAYDVTVQLSKLAKAGLENGSFPCVHK
jgi:hypothetical protein